MQLIIKTSSECKSRFKKIKPLKKMKMWQIFTGFSFLWRDFLIVSSATSPQEVRALVRLTSQLTGTGSLMSCSYLTDWRRLTSCSTVTTQTRLKSLCLGGRKPSHSWWWRRSCTEEKETCWSAVEAADLVFEWKQSVWVNELHRSISVYQQVIRSDVKDVEVTSVLSDLSKINSSRWVRCSATTAAPDSLNKCVSLVSCWVGDTL